MNIYMFWIGDKKKMQPLIDQINKTKHKLILGPTISEDKLLCKEYKYYRDSKIDKIYSFMSDVWRLKKLSENPGLYLDTSLSIGDDLNTFINKYSKYDASFFKENSNALTPSVMMNVKSNQLFKNILNIYKSYQYDQPRLFPILPLLMTNCLQNNFTNDYKDNIHNNIIYGSILNIRKKNEIFKYGSGSWNGSTIDDAKKYWAGQEKAFENENGRASYMNREFNKIQLKNISFDIWSLRALYKNSSKKEKIELKRIYINRNFKINIVDRLIWTRLFKIY